jgi:hypothetical protein
MAHLHVDAAVICLPARGPRHALRVLVLALLVFFFPAVPALAAAAARPGLAAAALLRRSGGAALGQQQLPVALRVILAVAAAGVRVAGAVALAVARGGKVCLRGGKPAQDQVQHTLISAPTPPSETIC